MNTLVKAGRSLSDEESANPCPAVGVQYKDMAAYSKAFKDRIDREGPSDESRDLKNMDTDYIPVQRLIALLETFALKHAARILSDLLETADSEAATNRQFLLSVLDTEVKGRNERRRKRITQQNISRRISGLLKNSIRMSWNPVSPKPGSSG